MSVFITADSTCDIPPEWAREKKIEIVPLSIVFGEKALKDGLEVRPEEIFQAVEAGGAIPHTAAVNVSEYREVFLRRLKECDAVVHVNISAEFSSCHANACQAAEGLPVYCVDSRDLSLGSGHLALEAARLRDMGLSGKEIADALRAMTARLETSFIISRLDYLWKGGRCSALSALGANLLKLRPCIEVRDGRMSVGKKYRGAFERCARYFLADRLAEPWRYERIILGHTGVEPELLEKLEKYACDAMGVETVDIVRVGCTITAHCGDNTVGLFLVKKQE